MPSTRPVVTILRKVDEQNRRDFEPHELANVAAEHVARFDSGLSDPGYSACVRTARAQPLLLFYAAPAVVMLGLDALIGNHLHALQSHSDRAVRSGAAWIMASWLPRVPGARWRWQFPASGPL
jgi:hypothetical protein